MKTAPFQELVMCLHHDQPPRVWSLLVTVFGELAQHEGARISGTLLRHLSALIGIKPEATRVALHRLRKDGWIDSQRTGRTSVYFLTPWGRAQSVAASPRIYAAGPAADAAWLVLSDPAQPADAGVSGATWVSATACITSDPPAASDLLATPLDLHCAVPDWIRTRVCDDTTLAMTHDFAAALDTLERHLAVRPSLDIVDSAALRVLIVHGWRRIVLKAPALPDPLFPTDWRGPVCRTGVASLLARYPRQDLTALEQAVLSDAAG